MVRSLTSEEPPVVVLSGGGREGGREGGRGEQGSGGDNEGFGFWMGDKFRGVDPVFRSRVQIQGFTSRVQIQGFTSRVQIQGGVDDVPFKGGGGFYRGAHASGADANGHRERLCELGF